ncbi:hypothetical protein NDA16_003206 [Ustilago loliicola]|nr:hypothetical protein NDA16_003206 [Ustilago loliicola]
MASTSLKGLTVLRSQVEAELTALERIASEKGSWQEPHPYSNGMHHIRFWEELLYVAFTFGPVLSIQDRFAFSMSAALRRKNKMRKPRGENVNSRSVKVDMVSQNGDQWTRLYIIKPERLRQEFREAESYMVDEQDSSDGSGSDDEAQLTSSQNDLATGESFHEHQHTAECSNATNGLNGSSAQNRLSNGSQPINSIAFDVAARKSSLVKLIHELRAAADTEAKARVQRSEEHGRQLPFIPIHVEIVVTRMELQTPSEPLPSIKDLGREAALSHFYQMSEWDRFNHRLAAIAQEAERHNVNMIFGYRMLPDGVLDNLQPPSTGLIDGGVDAKPMGLPKIRAAPARPQWRTTKKINLDVTAMIALVSDTTHGKFRESSAPNPVVDETKRHPRIEDGEHGSGALYQHHFRTFSIRKEALEARAAELSLQEDQQDEASRALDNAAAKEGRALAMQLEREMTVETLFDAILGPIWGSQSGNGSLQPADGTPVELFATVGAFDRLRRVSSTVGGPNEKRRVKALLGEEGIDPQDFWTNSKWDTREHEELRRCLILPIKPLQDLGPGGFESLTRLKQVYPDLPRAHFISHMVDTLESCLSELWGPDWRDISEDLPRSKYKKLRQSTVHQAGGQTYTTLRSMHACARYGMTTLTSNMDSIQWLLKEMSRRPYSEQTKRILEDASERTTPAKAPGEVQGYTIDDGTDTADIHIASSNGIMYSVDPIAAARQHEIETHDSNMPGSSLHERHYQDDMQPGLAWWRGITADFRFNKVHWLVLCLVYIGWILGFAFLAKSLWYESAVIGTDGVSRSPAFLSCTSTYWLRNGGCGLDGQDCAPFYTPLGEAGQAFRCPANCIDVTLLNPRAVGNERVNYQPLVVGGGDANHTYRGDSFICAAAIHAGVIKNSKGGCGSVRLIGAHAGFEASKANGIDSIGFDSTFPIGYRFEQTQGAAQCTDRRWEGYVLNAILSAAVGFVLRPKRIVCV